MLTAKSDTANNQNNYINTKNTYLGFSHKYAYSYNCTSMFPEAELQGRYVNQAMVSVYCTIPSAISY